MMDTDEKWQKKDIMGKVSMKLFFPESGWYIYTTNMAGGITTIQGPCSKDIAETILKFLQTNEYLSVEIKRHLRRPEGSISPSQGEIAAWGKLE